MALIPFGKYFLLERVNVGGMAEVFKAKTVGVEGFEKLVAIKRILPSVAEDEEFIKMFIDEAKITSQLSHANLAQTFDLGKISDAYYIAMEYVPGKDLRAVQERLKRRGERVPINVAAYVIGRVCEGLDYAHRKRDIAGRELHIVHRDVSPQNVIVSFEGEVKLIDFGIAKAANKITSTQAGILKGKFGYMSPEQVRGLPLDQRSDIFAAGVVLYELCTGERLFTGSSDYSVLEKVQQARITPPSQLVRDIPDRLEQVILKALAREPEQRYQHAADLAQDLMRFLIESHTRVVSRDDVAAFMKAVFPDDDARERRSEAAALDRTRTGARRPEGVPEQVRNDQPAQRVHFHEPRLREPPPRETPEQLRLDQQKREIDERAEQEEREQQRNEQARAEQKKREAQQAELARIEQQKREAAAREAVARKLATTTPNQSQSQSQPPPPPRSSRSLPPPKLPSSLIAGIDLAAEGGNELTPRGPTRPERSTDFLPTDPGGQSGQGGPPPLQPPPLAQQSARPPPMPAVKPASAPGSAKSSAPGSAKSSAPGSAKPQSAPSKNSSTRDSSPGIPTPSTPAKWTARDQDEQTEPGLFRAPSEDEPTRPMSMKELADAERIFIERERELHAANAAGKVEITSPGGPTSMPPPPSAPPSIDAVLSATPAKTAAAETATLEVTVTTPGAGAASKQSAPVISPVVAITQPSPPPVIAPAASTPAAAAAANPGAAKASQPAQPPARAPGAKTTPQNPPAEKPPPAPAPRGETARAARPSRPPAPLPATLLADVKAAATAQITDPGTPSSLPFADELHDDNTPAGRIRRGESPKAAGPRSGTFPGAAAAARLEQKRATPDDRPSFGSRMQTSKPMLIGDDPVSPEESTNSVFTQRARMWRWVRYSAIAISCVVIAWVWLSVPHKKEELAGPPSGSLTVTTKPEDALVLLDGTQVKGSLDRDYTEPKLEAGVPHALVVRREGFTEKTQTITLNANDQKVMTVELTPLPGQLTVRSTPSGAQVFLDGQAVGQTPAYLPNVVQEQSHAISLEKHCYRPWQVAIPAHAGRREVVATLEPMFGACPNMKVEKEEKMPDLPTDDPQAMASLGFLSLGSRPSASIFIDGVDIGRTTPLVQWPLKVGRHKIRLVLGAKKRDVTVEVRSGQTASEIVDLRKR